MKTKSKTCSFRFRMERCVLITDALFPSNPTDLLRRYLMGTLIYMDLHATLGIVDLSVLMHAFWIQI